MRPEGQRAAMCRASLNLCRGVFHVCSIASSSLPTTAQLDGLNQGIPRRVGTVLHVMTSQVASAELPTCRAVADV